MRVRHIPQELATSNITMSATNNTFDVAEFNRNVQQDIALKNRNNSMPKEDFTGFNHADFASWSKSSTGKPFNQPQITANKHTQQRPDNEWFDYDAFVTWAKSRQLSRIR